MNFEISLTIPEDSQRGHIIASLAAERHITPKEAVERIIDLAAESNLLGREQETPAAMVARARAQKAQKSPAPSLPGTEETIVGLFANDPEAVQAIRDAAAERRQSMYAF